MTNYKIHRGLKYVVYESCNNMRMAESHAMAYNKNNHCRGRHAIIVVDRHGEIFVLTRKL